MQIKRETCSAFIALTSARVAVDRSVTSRSGLAGAERTDDGVLAFECLTQDDLITRVSDDAFRSLKTARLFGRPRQYCYVVLPRYRLADDQAAGAAGRAKDQYPRLVGMCVVDVSGHDDLLLVGETPPLRRAGAYAEAAISAAKSR
jgi:hypothetical protein